MVRIDWNTVQDYYYVRRKNRVPKEYYRGKFLLIKSYFSDKPITYDTIGGFFTWLDAYFEKKNGYRMSNSTRNKYLSILKVIARLTGTNIDDVKSDNEEFDRTETEKLTAQEFQALCDTTIPYLRDEEYRNFIEILFLKVLVITAQRPGNVISATWNDYKNGYLYFRITKNSRPHKVYIPPHFQENIRKLRRYGAYIFSLEERKLDMTALNKMIDIRCKMAGITKHITLKSMRGTGITEYLKNAPIQKVMKISNHRDPKVLIQHYYDPENSEIEAIVDNNPFDPEPLTKDKIMNEIYDFVERLNKRDCEANVVKQRHNAVITVPLDR